jgi:hypothetical protein
LDTYPIFITIGASSSSINVNRTFLASPNDLGPHDFILTVKSSNFLATVTQKTYSFKVIVSCNVTSLTFSTSVPSTQTI